MSEPVIIDVRDKVNGNIEKKMRGIAKQAREADKHIESLKRTMRELDRVNPMRAANESMARAQETADKAALSSQKLATAQQQTALTAQRVATEQERTAAAALRLSTAQERAAATAEKSAQRQVASLETLKNKYNPLYAASKQYERALEEINQAERQGLITTQLAAQARDKAARSLQQGAVSMDKFGRSTQIMGFHSQNAAFQMQDVFVTAEMGMSPVRIAIQQGTQLSGVMQQMVTSAGSTKAALQGLWAGVTNMLSPMSLLVIGSIAAVAALIQWAQAAFSAENAGLKFQERLDSLEAIQQNVTATQELLKLSLTELADTYGTAATEVRQFAILQAELQLNVVQQDIDAMVIGLVEVSKAYTTASTAGRSYVNTLNRIADDFGVTKNEADLFNDALRELATVASIDDLTRELNDFQQLMDQTNVTTSDLPPEIANAINEMISLQREGSSAEQAAAQLADTVAEIAPNLDPAVTVAEQLKAELAASLALFNKVQAQSRLQYSGRGSVDPNGPTSADPAGESLESILGRADARERAAAKAARDAAKPKKARKGRSSKPRDVKDLQDYLAELEREAELLKLLPEQREIEAQVMRTVQQLKRSDISLSQAEIETLRQKITANKEAEEASRREQQVLELTTDKRLEQLEQLKASYALIDDMRSRDVLSEEQASAAKIKIWAQEQKAKTQVFSDFFGNLASLASSENEKVARIGKAAAITQTVINTYQSATAAYASMAGIPVVGPALGAAAAAAAVAAGLANVAAIRSQSTSGGYMGGGYTGDGDRTAAAGVVHRREFVMNSAATSRLGKDDLYALQRGAAVIQRPDENNGGAGGRFAQTVQSSNNGSSPQSLRIINVLDASIVQDFMQTDDGEKLILNVMKNNADELSEILTNG